MLDSTINNTLEKIPQLKITTQEYSLMVMKNLYKLSDSL